MDFYAQIVCFLHLCVEPVLIKAVGVFHAYLRHAFGMLRHAYGMLRHAYGMPKGFELLILMLLNTYIFN